MGRLTSVSRLLLGLAGPTLVLSGCMGVNSGQEPPTAVAPPSVATLAGSSGTPFTAVRGAGMETATVIGGGTGMTVDGSATPASATPATLTFFSNGSVALTAPNLPVDGTQDSITLSGFATSTSPSATGATTASGQSAKGGVYVQMTKFGATNANNALQYTEFGKWFAANCGTCAASSVGIFATGSATPAAQVPTSGAATYTGIATGYVGGGNSVYDITGAIVLNVNFAPTANGAAPNQVSGTITGNKLSSVGGSAVIGTANDIALSLGTIAASTGNFSGVAKPGTVAGSAIDLTPANLGTFAGGFYGGSAAEAAGSVKLLTPAGGNNATSVIMSFGAHK